MMNPKAIHRIYPAGMILVCLILGPGLVLASPRTGDEAEGPAPDHVARGLGDLLVTTYPEGAIVIVNSETLGTTPMEPRGVEPGWHLVRAEKSNLFASARVNVRTGELTTVALTLTDREGTLSVSSAPTSATVFVDGKERGRTPLVLSALGEGYHDLTVRKDGYLDYSTAVQVEADREAAIHVHLPIPATLDLFSTPEGARVYFADRYLGRTPTQSVPIRPGRTEVSLRLENYEDWVETYDLAEGEWQTVEADLVPLKHSIDILSEPPGAEIEMDGQLLGTTPLRWAVPLGEREFVFRLPAYEDRILRATISDDNTPEVRAVLTKVKGFLTLTTAPAGTKVTVLDSESSTFKAPLEGVAVDAGPRSLRLRAPGYETIDMEIVVERERETVVNPEWVPKVDTGGFHRAFVPGWSQHYQEKRIRSIAFPVAQAATLIGVLVTTFSYNDAVDEYENALNKYLNQVSPEAIEAAWHETENRYDRMEDKDGIRKVFLGAAVGVYIFNLIDAFFLAPDHSPERSAGIRLFTDSKSETVHVGFKVAF